MSNLIVKSNVLKNISHNISRMEISKSCLICVVCPSNFSFSNWEEFKSHKCVSECTMCFECIYCGLLVLWENGENHINSHFKHTNQALYDCSNCLYACNSKYQILKHTMKHQEISPNLHCRCHGCEEEFVSLEELFEHVHFQTIVVYNCCVTNCFVKCRNKYQIYEHYKRIHPNKSTIFEINFTLACIEATPDVVYTSQLIGRIPMAGRQLAMSIFNGALSQRTAGVYLECFKCHFSTSQWHTFIRHYCQCNMTTSMDSDDHHIYICSTCFTVSTKRHLIAEHLINCDRNADIVTETLPRPPTIEPIAIVKEEEITTSRKRNRSLSNNNGHEMPALKRPRMSESPDSKCKTDEAVMSDYEEPDLSTEFVSIPFDEEGFRSNNPNIPFLQKEAVVTKMRQFSQIQITIVGKENYGRIPECPTCHKIFTYGFGDFKRHFMTVHLEIEKEYIKECQKYTRLPKGGDRFQEIQEQLTMRNMRPKPMERDQIRVPLPYSIASLRKLTELLPASTQQYLAEKMKAYSIMSIVIQNVENSRRFLCHQCSYSSPYALADVRKHIMGSHCGISTKHFRYCLQASRLDPNEFVLLSDEKILNLAKDLKRRTKQKGLTLSNPQPPSTPVKLKKSPHNNRSKKWSKTPKKSRAKTEKMSEPVGLQMSSVGRKGVNALFLNADSTTNLSLPYSETVLETLLQSTVERSQIPSIMQKMKVYSSYSLTRLCQNDKTVAFQCPCGRVFHTSRVPDFTMRAATLADARRHVMGVHAKIPQSLITVCCQASRICRENDFQLYSDEMLLQMASERQAKMSDSRSNGHGNELRLPIDYQAESSVDAGDNNSFELSFVAKKNSFLLEDIPVTVDHASFNVDDEIPYVTDASATSRLDAEESDIERIIHLPYSLEALKCLTDGYCEPTFFSVLQEKMDVYSKYRIFVVRREGRRVFCCSGCLSSSPHGMGDVKKHILGVHARIPERFKAAAMHCSRLSREDMSLLPDNILLQLAKMKWKGSIIKPLSELTMEDRIKNFGKKSPDGKLFRMKSENCYSTFTLTRKDDELESKHYNEMIEDGLQLAANGDSEIIVPDDFYVLVDRRRWGESTYKCSMCEYESRFVGNCKGHIVREHLGIPPHSCGVCEQLFNCRSTVQSHHEKDHKESGLPFTLAHYGPYKIAISRISAKEMCGSPLGRLNGSGEEWKLSPQADGKRNSFLQHS